MDCFKSDKRNIKELIYYAERDDIKDMLKWKHIWKKIGNILIVMSYIFTFLGIGFSFSTSFFGFTYLAFISGCLNLLGVLFMKGANNAYNESEKRIAEINVITKSFGLKEIPDELKNITNNTNDNTIKTTNIDDNLKNSDISNSMNTKINEDNIELRNIENQSNNNSINEDFKINNISENNKDKITIDIGK